MKLIKVGSLVILMSLSLINTAVSADLFPLSSLFSQMDLNKDGLINRAEINKKSLLGKEFDNFDKNQDGNLDPSEFEFFIVTANI